MHLLRGFMFVEGFWQSKQAMAIIEFQLHRI